MPEALEALLTTTAERHSHLCPRQVLGVRMGLAGAGALGLEAPRSDKRLLIILETDGCFVDGIWAATRSSAGRRTLRIVDFGKVAATFIDTQTETCIRLSPGPEIRRIAWEYAPGEENDYQAQLKAYQVIPDERLFRFQMVQLKTSLQSLISQPGVRANCALCGEEIINEREVARGGKILCLACAGQAYYVPCLPSSSPRA
jgi:formylmethanofuran dehydrogenase subunit E